MTIATILYIIFVPFLPSIVWLVFFLREDLHPEPKRMILYAFNVGVIVSLPVLAAQLLLQGTFGSTFGPALSTLLLIAGLALIEEVFKFLGARWAVGRSPLFDEPVDAMIYMVTVALGFATVENFFITLNMVAGASALPLLTSTRTLALRFAGATLLHTITSGIVGYYWARGLLAGKLTRSLCLGLLLGTAVHAAFNYLVLKFQDTNLIYPSLILIAAAFFTFIDFEKLKIMPPRATLPQ